MFYLFLYQVQNDQCQKEEDSGSSVWPETTVDSKWGEARVSISPLLNAEPFCIQGNP